MEKKEKAKLLLSILAALPVLIVGINIIATGK
jgi:hypothetical protein